VVRFLALNPFGGTSCAALMSPARRLLLAEDPSRSAATISTMLKMLAVKIAPPTIPRH